VSCCSRLIIIWFYPPHELNPLIIRNRKALFKLFDAASQTIINHGRMPIIWVPIAEYDGATHLGTATQFSSPCALHRNRWFDGQKMGKRVKDNFVSRKEFEQDVQSHFPERIKNGVETQGLIWEISNEVENAGMYAKAPLAQVRWWNIWADTATK
jgi:hypothetical protein